MKKILVPVDGSVRSEGACNFILKNFSAKDYSIEILHVIKPGGNIEEAETFTNKAKGIFSKGGFVKVRSKIIESLANVGEAILEEAEKTKANMIVMSRYGADRSESVNIGDAVQEVVSSCPCNIIIVK
jgi:nucleotide-binding universal stress UspA family protein